MNEDRKRLYKCTSRSRGQSHREVCTYVAQLRAIFQGRSPNKDDETCHVLASERASVKRDYYVLLEGKEKNITASK